MFTGLKITGDNHKMRVAFTITKLGNWWAGGVNYFINLLSALNDLPEKPIEPVVFAGVNTDKDFLDRLTPYLSAPPIFDDIWTPGTSAYRKRTIQSLLLQRDKYAEKAFAEHRIDVVFQFFAWYGCRFSIPTIAWIADFQHRHLPDMFSRTMYLKREVGYHALALSATRIMVSSQDARQDCENFYPQSRGKISVLPFAVRIPVDTSQESPSHICNKYDLPSKYILLPNQFWKHKNHIAAIDALHILKCRGENITIAATGNINDYRNPEHSMNIMNLIRKYKLENNFRLLGSIPFNDIYSLMRGSVAVLNPSLFEGWSTTVEEAKSIGVPLILSDLRVHREQAPEACLYFDPKSPEKLAVALSTAYKIWGAGTNQDLEKRARNLIPIWRTNFGRSFVDIVTETAKYRTQ